MSCVAINTPLAAELLHACNAVVIDVFAIVVSCRKIESFLSVKMTAVDTLLGDDIDW